MLRHGESTYNRLGLTSGKGNTPLTDVGKQQAVNASQIIQKLNIKNLCIYTSNIKRAIQTSEIISNNTIPVIQYPEIAERDFGEWEGESWSNSLAKLLVYKNPKYGEKTSEFLERSYLGIKEILYNAQKNYVVPLIVSHGGIFYSFGFFNNYSNLHNISNCEIVFFQKNSLKKWDLKIISYDRNQDISYHELEN